MAYAGLPVVLGGANTRAAAILAEYVNHTSFDNISRKHFFSAWLTKNCLRGVAGGTQYAVPISIANNENFGFVARMAELASAMDDPVRRALFSARTLAGVVTVSSEDLADNSGSQGGVLDVLAESIASAERSIAEALSTALCGGAAAASANSVDGLVHLIRHNPANTVGGINRSVLTQYQNQHALINDFSVELANGGPNIIGLIRACSDGETRPNLILCDETVWDNWAAQYVLQQDLTTVDATSANMGFPTISWQGIPVGWDSHINPGGASIGETAGAGYVLSSDALALCVNTNQFKSKGVTLGDFTEIPNQLALGAKLAWRGALALTCGRGTGHLGITAF